MTYFKLDIDWLELWHVERLRADELQRIILNKEHEGFSLRVSTGSSAECHGGVSLDIMTADRDPEHGNDEPLASIRIPWSTAKLLGRFLSALPDEDPEL